MQSETSPLPPDTLVSGLYPLCYDPHNGNMYGGYKNGSNVPFSSNCLIYPNAIFENLVVVNKNKIIFLEDKEYKISDEKYICSRPTNNDIVIYLPDNPEIGRKIVIKDNTLSLQTSTIYKTIIKTNDLIESYEGEYLISNKSEFVLDTSGGCIKIMYDGVSWVLISYFVGNPKTIDVGVPIYDRIAKSGRLNMTD